MATAHLSTVFNVIGFRPGVMHAALHHAWRCAAASAAAAADRAAIMKISFLSSQQREMNFTHGLTPDFHLSQRLTP